MGAFLFWRPKTSNKEKTTTLEDSPAQLAAPIAASQAPTETVYGSMEAGLRKYRVIVPQGPNPEDREGQFVGINGKDFLIPRGKPVVITEDVLEVLNNANRTVMDYNGQNAREINRFNTQVLGEVI